MQLVGSLSQLFAGILLCLFQAWPFIHIITTELEETNWNDGLFLPRKLEHKGTNGNHKDQGAKLLRMS